MIEAFYPKYTENIWHTGKLGNKYRLDSLNRVILVKKAVSKTGKIKLHIVDSPDDSVLKFAASPALLRSYKTGRPSDLANSSGVLWQKNFYPWIVNAAWSHILAAQTALKEKSALALADGAHHAQKNSGYGFGPINNLVLAAKFLLKKKLVKRVAILDIDVHYGNGTHSQIDDKRILSADLWRYKLDKWQYTETDKNVFHVRVDNTKQYFEVLPTLLSRINDFRPDILFIYCGLDVLDSDRMGGIINFGEHEVLERNKIIRKSIKESGIPVVFSVGGGYINYSNRTSDIKKQQKAMTSLFVKSIHDLLDI